MRVVYTIPSPGFRYFIPRNKSVPDDSCVYIAMETNEITHGTEDRKTPRHPVYNGEAMYLPPLDGNDVTPRAVVLISLQFRKWQRYHARAQRKVDVSSMYNIARRCPVSKIFLEGFQA